MAVWASGFFEITSPVAAFPAVSILKPMTEISAANQSELNKRYKTALKIYLGQIITAVILVLIGWFVAANVENAITSEGLFSLRLGVLFIAIVTFILRRMLLRWDRLKNIYLLKGMPGLLSSLATNAIILGTLAEIVAVLGFLIATLGGVKTDMLTFGAIALILFFINFPRKGIWEKVVSNLEKV